MNGEWPDAEESAGVGGPVRSVTDGGDHPRLTLPVLLDVPQEVWDRVVTDARERARHPGAPDPEFRLSDALSEHVRMEPIVVVDGEVRDVSDVFPDADLKEGTGE